MSEGPNNFNRRDILKGTGVAATGLATSTGLAAAADPIDPDEARERALGSKYVRSILNELNRPNIEHVDGKELTQEYGSGKLSVTAVDLETALGTLTYAESDGENTAMFQFDTATLRNGRSPQSLPEKYHLDAHVEAALLTIDADVGVVFLRTATPIEQKRLSQKTGVAPSDTAMFYNSKIGGFEVHPLANDSQAKPNASDGQSGAFLVKPSKPIDGPAVATEPASPDEMWTEQVVVNGKCQTWAFSCMGSINACAACVMACGSIPVVPVAVAGCVACVLASCGGAVPISCHKVYDECG